MEVGAEQWRGAEQGKGRTGVQMSRGEGRWAIVDSEQGVAKAKE